MDVLGYLIAAGVASFVTWVACGLLCATNLGKMYARGHEDGYRMGRAVSKAAE